MARSSSSSSGRRSSSSYPSSGASACDRSRAAAQPFFPRCSLMTDEKKVRRPAFARPAAPPPLSPRGAAQQSAALGSLWARAIESRNVVFPTLSGSVRACASARVATFPFSCGGVAAPLADLAFRSSLSFLSLFFSRWTVGPRSR